MIVAARMAGEANIVNNKNIENQSLTNELSVQRYADKVKNDIEDEIALTLINPGTGYKIPYNKSGINQIKNAIVSVLRREYDAGRISDYEKVDTDNKTVTVPFEVTMPSISDISTSDKNSRILNNVEIKFRYSSAIHSVTMTGTMTV